MSGDARVEWVAEELQEEVLTVPGAKRAERLMLVAAGVVVDEREVGLGLVPYDFILNLC